MTTRVDPELYRDTPIFRQILRDRKGRWPGIPANELPPVSLIPVPAPLEEPSAAVPVISLVHPIPPAPQARTRPYAKEFLPQDPDATAEMPLPHVAEG